MRKPPKSQRICSTGTLCGRPARGFCDECKAMLRLALELIAGPDDRGPAGKMGCPVEFDTARRREIHRARIGDLFKGD